MSADDFVKDLDAACVALLEGGPRAHLGASQIGTRCARAPWYGFRQVLHIVVDGRVQRLFNRGQVEEIRIVRWLRAMGVEVQEFAERLWQDSQSGTFVCRPWDEDLPFPWCDVSEEEHTVATAIALGEGPKQWSFADHDGHYSGSADGKVRGLEKWFPEVAGLGWGLLECKTHGDKSYKEYLGKAVQVSKEEHYVQMQEYMHYLDLKWAMYFPVNKNDDAILPEIVMYRPEVAKAYSDRAGKIIEARVAPAKVSTDPSWFGCRFCDFKRICHFDEAVQKNCRSCQYASPGPDKTWECGLHRQTIPATFIPHGCGDWIPVK